MQVWRICKQRYAAYAFSGEGARLYGGRWNPPGTRMVYTSSSLALAAMELFVHLDPSDAPSDLVSLSATFHHKELDVHRIDMDQLPGDWRRIDHPVLQSLGAAWIVSQCSVVLEVPSVAIEGEWNVLLNPAHPGFSKMEPGAPKPFHFDSRMFQSAR